VRLLIKTADADGRLSLLPRFLDTPWDVEVVDVNDGTAFERALEGADAMVSMNWQWHVPQTAVLRLLQLPGAGLDEVDFSRLPPRIAVCNCFEHEIGIAEYVLGAMLDWSIGFRRLDAQLRRGRWEGSYLLGPRHRELYGKTVGILGYGHIGREVARRARAFGMKIICCTRTPARDELAHEVLGMDQLRALLSRADFIVVSLPLTDDTRGILDRDAIARMQPQAVLINVARGAIVDEEALYTALKERRIGGAILDVWYRYPRDRANPTRPSRFSFETLDNVLMTPHASGWTDALLERRNRAMAANLNRLARGEPLLNVVRGAL
jgi:phosphoglycerate dehydrogenase-like enzyme